MSATCFEMIVACVCVRFWLLEEDIKFIRKSAFSFQ